MDNNLNVNKNDHITGSENAPIECIEYGDYQCPYCAEAYYVMKDVKNKLGNDIKFVFRNFPLTELHPYALKAAMTAESAAQQGKFWEMHDLLYENQQNLQDEYLLKYAEDLGLDMEKFKEDFGKQETFNKVNADFNSGVRHHVQGTPTFFINGELFNGNWASPEFADYLESLIGEKVNG